MSRWVKNVNLKSTDIFEKLRFGSCIFFRKSQVKSSKSQSHDFDLTWLCDFPCWSGNTVIFKEIFPKNWFIAVRPLSDLSRWPYRTLPFRDLTLPLLKKMENALVFRYGSNVKLCFYCNGTVHAFEPKIGGLVRFIYRPGSKITEYGL